MTSITPSPEMVERAMKPISMGDVRLAAGEGQLSAHDVLAAVNGILASRRRSLTAALSCPDGFRLAAFQFVQWAMQEGAWEGCSLDGGSLQDKAEALGLIVNEPYDTERHGPSGLDPEPGCDWYVLHPEIRAMLAVSPAPAVVDAGWRPIESGEE